MIRIFAFLGGALFVTALAFCAWSYLIVWGAPDRHVIGAVHLIVGGHDLTATLAAGLDVVLFTVFAAHHSLFAREPVKSALRHAAPPRMIRPLYVWTASLLLMVVCAAWVPVGGSLYHHRGGWAALHAGVQLAGLWITAASVRLIDPFELAGMRVPADSAALQIAGPYRWVRHPIYLGWALMVFGAANLTGARLAFAAISTGYLAIAVPWEERSLERVFGDAYRAYRRRVRWRMVPYVY